MQQVGNRKVKNEYFKNAYGGNYRKAIEMDGYKCAKCGGESYLIIHHKDGNRRNNDLDNLTTLCKSCHADAHGQILRFKNPNLELIAELIDNGITYREIAEHLGVTRQRVHQIVRQAREKGFPMPEPRRKGKGTPSSLLEGRNKAILADYLKLADNGKPFFTIGELAEKYHLSRIRINQILRGLTNAKRR